MNEKMTNQERALKLLARAMLEFGEDKNYKIGFDPEDEGYPYVNVMECGVSIAQVYYDTENPICRNARRMILVWKPEGTYTQTVKFANVDNEEGVNDE